MPDEDAFVRQQLSGLMAYPTYYASMAPINRAGPTLLATTMLAKTPAAWVPTSIASRARVCWSIRRLKLGIPPG